MVGKDNWKSVSQTVLYPFRAVCTEQRYFCKRSPWHIVADRRSVIIHQIT